MIAANVDWGSEPWLVTLGDHVYLTTRVQLITHDGGTWVLLDDPIYADVIKYGEIVIGDNVFVGLGSTIMPGVHIGDNCVIGAMSLVTKDVPSNTVAAGNPARVLCTYDEYARKCLGQTPDYDKEAYRTDKRREVLRIIAQRENS